MARKLEKIQLHLENCDTIELSAKEVSHIYFGQAPKSYYSNCGRWFQHEYIDDIGIVLNIDKDKAYKEFGIDEYTRTVFDRLCGNDITQITVYSTEKIDEESGKEHIEHFHVVWHKSTDEYGMDYSNKKQKTEWIDKNEEEDIRESFCRITINSDNEQPIK